MEYEHLTIERNGRIAVVTLNRPEKSNALNIDLMAELEALADEFREDVKTLVVVFTGSGKHFSSGADLSDPQRAKTAELTKLGQLRRYRLGGRMLRKLYQMPQITIAAVNGVALGGGACLVTALDFRIGASDCLIGYPEVNLGLSLSWVSIPLCVHLIGPAKAKRMIILARKEKAADLLAWGLLDEVVPPEGLMARAMEMAEEYAAQAPIAAQMTKRSVNAVASALDQAVMHMDVDELVLTSMSDDYIEGVTSFFEKRPPEFKGD